MQVNYNSTCVAQNRRKRISNKVGFWRSLQIGFEFSVFIEWHFKHFTNGYAASGASYQSANNFVYVHTYILKCVRLLLVASAAFECMSTAARCDVTQNANRQQIVSKPCDQLPVANRLLPYS